MAAAPEPAGPGAVDPVVFLEHEQWTRRQGVHDLIQTRVLVDRLLATRSSGLTFADQATLREARSLIAQRQQTSVALLPAACPTCGTAYLAQNCGGGPTCGALPRDRWRQARGLVFPWG